MSQEPIGLGLSPEYDEIVSQYEKKIYDLKQLLEISRSLCSTIEFSQLIESVLYTCMGQFRVLGAGVFVLDALDSDEFVLDRNYNGLELDSNVNYKIPVNNSLITAITNSGKVFTLEELKQLVPADGNIEAIASLRPSLIVPLVQKNHLLGDFSYNIKSLAICMLGKKLQFCINMIINIRKDTILCLNIL